VGCGLQYKKGFVNIDAYDSTVADRVMSVTHLEFDDQSFTHVDCNQVLEHLGAAKSIYALSEIYRVLKPSGSLLVETPDLLNSFKSFIKGDENNRKMIMNWIYGLDMPGMSHRYGFPKELLERMLRETGFSDIKITHINLNSLQPSLRATCKKANSMVHQVISIFRKRLIEEGIVNLENQIEVIEKEMLIQDLVQIVLNADMPLDHKWNRAIVERSAVCSPIIGRVFLDCVCAAKLSSDASIEHIKILEELDSLNFVNILTYIFSEMPIRPGQQDESFASVIKLGKQIVGKLMAKDHSAIDEIRNTSKKIQEENHNDFFSNVGLQVISSRKLALGLKAFGAYALEEAISLIQDAIRFNHDSTLAFWNLARIFGLKENKEKMLQYYSTVRNLLMLQYPKSYRSYISNLENEKKTIEVGNCEMYARPIFSYQ
jgi:predicted SAM-dependent methyltransferase